MCAYLRLSAFICAGMCPYGMWVCVWSTNPWDITHMCTLMSPPSGCPRECVCGDHNFRVVILEFTLIISHICCNASFNASLQEGCGEIVQPNKRWENCLRTSFLLLLLLLFLYPQYPVKMKWSVKLIADCQIRLPQIGFSVRGLFENPNVVGVKFHKLKLLNGNSLCGGKAMH